MRAFRGQLVPQDPSDRPALGMMSRDVEGSAPKRKGPRAERNAAAEEV